MTAKTSANLQPALMKLYRGQMNAFQLAITNFVEGYREGAAEKVDLSKVFQGAGNEEGSLSEAARGLNQLELQQNGSGSAFPTTSQQILSRPGDTDSAESNKAPQDAEPTLSASSKQQRNMQARNVPNAAPGPSAKASASRESQQASGSSPGSSTDSFSQGSTPHYPGTPSLGSSTPPDGDQDTSGHTEPQADQNSQLDSNHKIATMPKQPIVKASLDSSSGRHLGREGESPHVLSALDRAEELARALMEPGGVTPERRKDLEAAIADAEAAMSQVAEKLENK